MTATFGDIIVFRGTGFNAFADKAGVVLYLNDVPMDSVFPLSVNGTNNKATFVITRSRVIDKFVPHDFQSIMAGKTTVPVRMSFGFRNGQFIQVNAPNLKLELFSKGWMWVGVILIILMLVMLLILAKRSDILKTKVLEGQTDSKYSLSRTQMAWWTFIITASFIYLWVVTGDMVMTTQALLLMGISIGTTAASSVVDQSPSMQDKLNNRLSSRNDRKNKPGFWEDLLSDGQGVSIHRFQNVVFTLIIGLIFLKNVVVDLAMPQMDDQILILMGISAGTYVGLKTYERGGDEPAVKKPDPQGNGGDNANN